MKSPLEQIALVRTYARSIGWRAAIGLSFSDFLARMGIRKGSLLRLEIKNAQYPLFMRIGSSDREVLEQIFIEEEYETIAVESPRTILDLGANVGYSSAYLLSKYPDTSVVAVEPDSGKYAMCRRNLEAYGSRARVVHGAVWPERRKLAVDRGAWRDGREWTAQVRPAEEENASSESVDGYDMPTLIGLSGETEIDLLKIDIERSELELFSRNTESWLPRIRNLCIELHGADCEAIFSRALADYSCDLSCVGELTVCSNLQVRW